jgi:hypothetical protein
VAADPFNGHPLNSPYATRRKPNGTAAGGTSTDDPAWQPPTDPLKHGNRAGLIRREIPITTTSTSWTVPLVREAMQSLVIGLFDMPSQLIDALLGNARIQAAMNSRTGGLLGREVDFLVPKKFRDSPAAQECCDAFIDAWPALFGEGSLVTADEWEIMLGFAPGQLLWDLDGEYGRPVLEPWHPRWTYWHFLDRSLVAIGQDGQERITPGDGHWFLHTRRGAYRGWMRGAFRAVAEPWLARCYARRDWARYSERHGMPIIKAKTPSDAEVDTDVENFRTAMANLGQETSIELPQGKDPTESYDVEYLETKDQSWEGFQSLIDSCDAEITLAIMSQNLTTEVKEGSFAAARVHADVRQSLLEADARALARTIYSQIARPFAALNFGNADLAPAPKWDVKPYEDDLTAAQTFYAFSQGLSYLATAGFGVDKLDAFARRFGIDMGAAKFIKRAAPVAPPREPDEDEE